MKTNTTRNALGQFVSFSKLVDGAHAIGAERGFRQGLEVSKRLISTPSKFGAGQALEVSKRLISTPSRFGAGQALAVGTVVGVGLCYGVSKLLNLGRIK